tara:strand:+ start:1088 stop:1252 length:165 start_codon:yes stop_codon:yes gene_type:complete
MENNKEREQTEQENYLSTVLSQFNGIATESKVLEQENHNDLNEWYYNSQNLNEI